MQNVKQQVLIEYLMFIILEVSERILDLTDPDKVTAELHINKVSEH